VTGPRRAALAIAVVVAALAWLAGPAAADRDYVVHKVKKGDTLALLAAEYYGHRNHAVFIMVANKMQHPRPLRPGEKIRIPVSREVTTQVGDTLEGLAQAYLGDKRRAPYLAEFNSLPPDASLAAGLTISVPFHVVHTAATDESLASIAAAYFGNSKNAELLRGYNFLDGDTVPAGRSITVPINHVKVRSGALPPVDAESRARTEKRRAMLEAAGRAVDVADADWRHHDYNAVKRVLITIDLDFLDGDRVAAIGTLLGAAYVALGDDDSALATFRKVLERQPDTEMSPYRYSPRIRAVWSKAGGTVAAETAGTGAGAP